MSPEEIVINMASDGTPKRNQNVCADSTRCLCYSTGAISGSSRSDSVKMWNSNGLLWMLMCAILVNCLFVPVSGVVFGATQDPVDGFREDQSEADIQAVKEALQKLEEEMLHETNGSSEESIPSGTELFEGDIRLTPGEAENILASYRNRKRRKISADENKRWPLPIHYRFNDSPKFFLNQSERAVILSAIQELSALTCITFKEYRPGDKARPVLDFRKDVGCWPYVGREKAFRFQEISTAKGCFQKGILLHELGHAIGFWHEQARPDRDSYVTYRAENVKRGEQFNFKRESWGDIDNKGVPYDVGSIMHYGSSFYTKNGKVTLETRDPLLQRNLGQRKAMSFFDVKLANLAYCKGSCPLAKFSCLHDGYPDPKACHRCRCPDGLSGSRCQYAAQPKGANCGGPTFVDNGAKYTIRSPGYPWAYRGNTECSWLFQARPGARIYLSVNRGHFMRHPTCPSSNLSVCADYLEVKYNISFGYTGARFCCGEAPRDVIVSSGNTMLVLFRSSRNGIGGFSADVYTESCGGCFQKAAGPQKPCYTTETVACRQQWYKMEFVPCPVSYRPPTYVCNKYLPKKHTRTRNCQVEKKRCCSGYTIKNDLCIPVAATSTEDTTTVMSNDVTTRLNSPPLEKNKTDATPNGWTRWSQWSQCSATCGGCGRRSRTRSCQQAEMCGGRREDNESQVCNTQPCPNLVAYSCSRSIKEQYNCGWLRKCTRTKTVRRQCVTRCCPNYEDKSGICRPVVNRKRKRKK